MTHGTATAARANCTCDTCRHYRTRMKKLWRVRTQAPTGGPDKDKPRRPANIPIAPVHAHIDRLLASGWTLRQIAAETGRTQQALWNVLRRPTRNGAPKTRIRRDTAAQLLALEPLPRLDDYTDPVVVDRLIAGADWQTIGATRAERIAAAERLAWYWTPIRARQRAEGMAEQACDGESLTSIERRFGLRAGRDFRKAPDAVAQRGAA